MSVFTDKDLFYFYFLQRDKNFSVTEINYVNVPSMQTIENKSRFTIVIKRCSGKLEKIRGCRRERNVTEVTCSNDSDVPKVFKVTQSSESMEVQGTLKTLKLRNLAYSECRLEISRTWNVSEDSWRVKIPINT